MSNIALRPAAIKDLPILYSFEQGIVSTERPFDSTLKAGHINYYDIKALIESSDAEVIVCTVNDEIIGSAYVKIKDAQPYLRFGQYAYLGFMFVHPDHRGKGISRRIIDRLKTWAQSRGLNELRLEVYDENHNAIRAYEKFGFKKHIIEMRIDI